jgi:hypothetical protein
MRQQRLGDGRVARRKALHRDAVQAVVNVRDNVRRCVECQVENRGSQRADQNGDLLEPTVVALMIFAQARAEQRKIGEGVL